MFMKHVSSMHLSFWTFDNFFCDYFICCVSCTVVVLTYFVMGGCFDNCVGVLVLCVLVFTVFCIVCTVFLYCFVYGCLFLFVSSVLLRTTATK